jgi:peptide/nickel transport system substrate-binding protein
MNNRHNPGHAIVSTRRSLLGAVGFGSIAAGFGYAFQGQALAQTPVSEDLLDELVIDLPGVPESIDPALAYSARDWSIVHSIYDAPVTYLADGTIAPLAAESFDLVDETTFELVLREGLTFHDGSPVTSSAVTRSLAHMMESGSEASGLFAGITGVEEVDERTARIITGEPAPWLPGQIAVWLVLLPEGISADSAGSNPVGSGPYKFESQEAGASITLVRNPDYVLPSAKGRPIAERVKYRFVPEVTTRVADLSTGVSHIISEVPHDQLTTVEETGGTAVESSIVGSQWIRIATDVPPFDQVEVRQALNHAIDVEAIAQALVSPEAHRLASIVPDDRSIAFNPDLAPYEYDPDRAKQLLSAAGVEDLEFELEITSAARVDVAEAIAAQLGEVGLRVSIKVSEYTEFNANWANVEAPVLRMVTWSPLYDPHTLLSLAFDGDGYLSRYANDEVDALIDQASTETDPEARAGAFREMMAVMREDAPVVFLWNLTAGYGVAPEAGAWLQRGDEYVLPLGAGEGS